MFTNALGRFSTNVTFNGSVENQKGLSNFYRTPLKKKNPCSVSVGLLLKRCSEKEIINFSPLFTL